MQYNMIRHIRETPAALQATLENALPTVKDICRRLRQRRPGTITITGCGASYHDALGAELSFESLLNTPTSALPASEVGMLPKEYFGKDRLLIAISRSGEKGDIMSAVRRAKQSSSRVLAITATQDSLLAREADEFILTSEGPEYCQPKTKSFVSVLGVLNLLAVQLMGPGKRKESLLSGLFTMPDAIERLIRSCVGPMRDIAPTLKPLHSMYVTGTGATMGAVLEAALKLKETSFVHAEGFATGEVAQGPLLLLGKRWGYIPFVTEQGRDLAVRIMTAARQKGARIIALSERTAGLTGTAHHVVRIPTLPTALFAPMAYIIPVQFLAYYLAVEKRLNPDDPRGFDMILNLILEPGRKEPEMRGK